MNNKRTIVNSYKDIVLSDPYTDLIYNFVYQQHKKIVNKIHPFRLIIFTVSEKNILVPSNFPLFFITTCKLIAVYHFSIPKNCSVNCYLYSYHSPNYHDSSDPKNARMRKI